MHLSASSPRVVSRRVNVYSPVLTRGHPPPGPRGRRLASTSSFLLSSWPINQFGRARPFADKVEPPPHRSTVTVPWLAPNLVRDATLTDRVLRPRHAIEDLHPPSWPSFRYGTREAIPRTRTTHTERGDAHRTHDLDLRTKKFTGSTFPSGHAHFWDREIPAIPCHAHATRNLQICRRGQRHGASVSPCLFLSLPPPPPFQPLPSNEILPLLPRPSWWRGRFTRPLAPSLPIAVPFWLPCRIAVRRQHRRILVQWNPFSPHERPLWFYGIFQPLFRSRSSLHPVSVHHASSISITLFVSCVLRGKYGEDWWTRSMVSNLKIGIRWEGSLEANEKQWWN